MHNPDKFHGKYRIPSTRWKLWNYADPGRYFITICTKNREHCFGYVRDGEMVLSDYGKIVDGEWNRTPLIRPYVELDRYIVMPNHFHGIVILRERPVDAAIVETPWDGVSTNDVEPTRNPHHHPEWQPGCVGAIIHQFKRACTIRIRQTGFVDFAWQKRFHDRVIRNGQLDGVRRYIENNPRKWNKDPQEN